MTEPCLHEAEIAVMKNEQKHIAHTLNKIDADLSDLRLKLLNAGKGIVQDHSNRISALEGWRKSWSPVPDHKLGKLPRWVQSVPWWGWVVIIAGLRDVPPELWDLLTKLVG